MRIKRRIPSHACLNGPDFVRGFPQNTTCSCTVNDVECDYGFLHTDMIGIGNGVHDAVLEGCGAFGCMMMGIFTCMI